MMSNRKNKENSKEKKNSNNKEKENKEKKEKQNKEMNSRGMPNRKMKKRDKWTYKIKWVKQMEINNKTMKKASKRRVHNNKIRTI